MFFYGVTHLLVAITALTVSFINHETPQGYESFVISKFDP